MNMQNLVKEYLENNKALQLATVSEGQPWLCTVYFVADEDFNLYWSSAKMRQHSQEIIAHPTVAATIVQDLDRKQALQITGTASIVGPEDIERVNKLYASKFGDKPERLQEVLANKPDGRAYWAIKPDTISLWDEVNFPDDPKQTYL